MRCRQTVGPSASAFGVAPHVEPWLREGAPVAGFFANAAACADWYVCSHADVVAGILERLVEEGILAVEDVHVPTACLWRIEMEGSHVTSAVLVSGG